MRFDSLIDAVQSALQQELDLLDALSDELYRAPSAGFYSSSVGMHLRHCLDHFAAFFDGLPKGQIDYESRGRNTLLEASRSVAAETMRQYIGQLEALRSSEACELNVREESEAGAEQGAWLPSSLGRELQFLLGHTVHHNALIAMIVHGHGVALPASFGVAPSTQRYEQKRPASS